MKKGLLLIFAFLVVLLIAVYILIPQTIKVSKIIGVQSTVNGTQRVLADAGSWHKWWPANAVHKGGKRGNVFKIDEYQFQPAEVGFNTVVIQINTDTERVNSVVQILSVKVDSTSLAWQAALEAGNNPFKKITMYLQAVRMKKEMVTVLASLKNFLEKPEQVYGFKIHQEQVKDTFLISTRATATQYPDSQMIYHLINGLREYAVAQGAKETNYPMLHMFAADSTGYEVMVALPVDKVIKGNEKVAFKRMVPGNILVTDTIKGGPKTIQQAFTQMEYFLQDYHRTPPAIPFESLITDRLQQPDTTQWRTKIYYPVY